MKIDWTKWKDRMKKKEKSWNCREEDKFRNKKRRCSERSRRKDKQNWKDRQNWKGKIKGQKEREKQNRETDRCKSGERKIHRKKNRF